MSVSCAPSAAHGHVKLHVHNNEFNYMGVVVGFLDCTLFPVKQTAPKVNQWYSPLKCMAETVFCYITRITISIRKIYIIHIPANRMAVQHYAW